MSYAIYLRKSRADSKYECLEEILQRHETILQEYAVKVFGEEISEQNIYREIVSGETIQDRPQIQRLLDKIQKNEYIGVLVIEPQRLSRGDIMDCGIIIRVFQYSKTFIVTPNKTYNLQDKFDRKFFEMELIRGSDYLEYTKEVLSRGRVASVREGYYVGSITPYGYDRIKLDKHYTLSPNNEATVVKMIFEMFTKENLGTTNIARKLDSIGIKARNSKSWTSYTIRDILKNPVYIGKIKWNNRKTVKSYQNGEIIRSRPRNKGNDNILAPGKHPAIIDIEVFEIAQSRFGEVARVKGWSELRNPFATLVVCNNCGHSMSYRTYIKDGKERNTPRMLCNNQAICKTKSTTYYDFVNIFLNSLRKNLSEFELKLKNSGNDDLNYQSNVINKLNKELSIIEEQQIRLYNLLETGIYSKEIFLMRNQALAEHRENTKKAIEKTKSSKKKL